MPTDPFQQTRTLSTAAGPLLFRPIRPGDEAELLAFFRDRLSPRSQYLFCPHDPSNPQRCLEQFAERIRRHGERRDLGFVVERDGAVLGYFFLYWLDRTDGQRRYSIRFCAGSRRSLPAALRRFGPSQRWNFPRIS